ncbi:hypothetical protein [Aquimarina longa]|uniref:hypothetical protein n=1 Tax=Aquimarina longa TaxID=1080221 RepID=UPI0011DF55C5|nr:hypothetical protein [Aquimarina longa]
MRYVRLVLLLVIGLIISCTSDDDTTITPANQNKVLILKVDYETKAFEGGKELVFDTTVDFDLETKYVAPGDFGSITLLYKNLDKKLFSGSIIWNGVGAITYPENLTKPDDFTKIDTPVVMPDGTIFETIAYDVEPHTVMDGIDHQQIWSAVSNLLVFKEYRINNPNAKIHLMLYKPAVGIEDLSKSDWILIVKN